MVLTGLHKMEMAERPMPRIQSPHDVLLRMSVVGVCGSDIHYYETGRIGSQVVSYPFTVGHEGAGVVVDVGSAVTHVKPGDLCAIEPAMPCYQCDQCLADRKHTCRKIRFLGCPGQSEGCLSEYLLMPETSCFPIRASLTDVDAALSEPLAIGWYAAQMADAGPSSRFLVQGAGPIGLSVLVAARARGATEIVVSEPIPERRKVALRLGARAALDPGDNLASALPGGYEAVIECCGEQQALDQAVDLLEPGGRLYIVGIPSVDRISFSIDMLRRKELTIHNVRRQNECLEPTLDWMEKREIDLSPMVTHRFSFEQTPEAFELVAGYRDGVVKAMVHFG